MALLLVSLFFFSITFQTPVVFFTTEASPIQKRVDVVSFLVEQELYNTLEKEIEEYASLIQSQSANTRVVIFPFSQDISPYTLSSLNRQLYFEGEGTTRKQNTIERLVGTVIIGDLPLPVVSKSGKDFVSIFPYVDFVEPHFWYQEHTKKFEYISSIKDDTRPEIWHAVLYPNSGNDDQDIRELKDFFKKADDFHSKANSYAKVFSKPHVLYIDTYHEGRSISPEALQVYGDIFLPTAEDRIYNRYTKYLAEYITTERQKIFDGDGEYQVAPFQSWDPELIETDVNRLDFASVPDAQAKNIIDKTATHFVGTLNEKYVGDVARFVHNSGRYYTGHGAVLHDTIPELITKKDALVAQTIKDINGVLEAYIDATIENNYARNIALLTEAGRPAGSFSRIRGGMIYYDNYFYGRTAKAITNPNQCGIVRGSAINDPINPYLVEFNTAYNPYSSQAHTSVLNEDRGRCFDSSGPRVDSFWGGNSPLNFDFTNGQAITLDDGRSSPFDFDLKSQRYTTFTKDIFDLVGWRELQVSDRLHDFASPAQCQNHDLIMHPTGSMSRIERVISRDDVETIVWPAETGGQRYSCVTSFGWGHVNPTNPLQDTFEDIYIDGANCEFGTRQQLRNRGIIGNFENDSYAFVDEEILLGCRAAFPHNGLTVFAYKPISSLVHNTSPTDEEYGAQLTSLSADALPVDKDRYITFFNTLGNTEKIVYPNIFRLQLEDFSESGIQKALQVYLQNINNQIGNLATRANVQDKNLTQKQWEVINFLTDDRLGSFWSNSFNPEGFDAYGFLSKNSDLFRILMDALYWNSLPSVEDKYAYVFQNYIEQKEGTKSDQVLFSDHKDIYEIGYIGSLGTATGMRSSFDPSGEQQNLDIFLNPEQDVEAQIKKNIEQFRSVQSANNQITASESGEFRCGPAEGVPIQEWLGAITCWLGSLLPIQLVYDNEEVPQDENDNSIPDAYEIIGKESSTIQISTSKEVFDFTQQFELDVYLQDSSGNTISVDNGSLIQLDILSIQEQGDDNIEADEEDFNEYMSFAPSQKRAVSGHAQFLVNTKTKHADVVLQASIVTRNTKWEIIVDKKSDPFTISIRPERIHLISQVFSEGLLVPRGSIQVGEEQEIVFKRISEDDFLYPVRLEVYKEDEKLYDTAISKSSMLREWYVFEKLPSTSDIFTTVGSYVFRFIGRDGDEIEKKVAVEPWVVDHAVFDSFSSVLPLNKSTKVLVSLEDVFGNRITKNHNVNIFAQNLEISQNNITISSGDEITIDERGIVLDIVPVDTENVLLRIEGEGFTSEQEFEVIESLITKVSINNDKPVVVGGNEYRIDIEMVDENGIVVEGLDTSMAISLPEQFGFLDAEQVEIENGRGIATLTTDIIADTDVELLVDSPIANKVEGTSFDILSQDPLYINAITNTRNITIGENVIEVEAQLLDIYGNVANISGLDVEFQLSNRNIFTLSRETAKVLNGRTNPITIDATGVAGTEILTATVVPSLKPNEKNYENVVSISSVEIPLVSQLVLQDTAFTNYNTLYTALLGAEYGDIETEKYLAGRMIFADKSIALGASALLQSPYIRDDVFSISNTGDIENLIPNQQNTTLDISIIERNNQLIGIVEDVFASQKHAEIYWKQDYSNTYLGTCIDVENNTQTCDLDIHDSFIVLGGDIASVGQPNADTITMSYENEDIVTVTSGGISLAPSVTLHISEDIDTDFLVLDVRVDKKKVGYIFQKIPATRVFTTQEKTLADKKDTGIVVLFSDALEKIKKVGTSSQDIEGNIFALKNEWSKDVDTRLAFDGRTSGFEEYIYKKGIGWHTDNKLLLEFSSGASAAQAHKNHQTYSMVYVGHPLLQLDKKQLPPHNYDRTVGTQLTTNERGIESYESGDMNNDGLEDVIVFYDSGDVELFINSEGELVSVGDIANISNSSSKRKAVGDIFNDGYEEVIYVDESERLVVLDNNRTTFTRILPDIQADETLEEPLENAPDIISLKVYDMDQDGFDDIVILQRSGLLSILYGSEEKILEQKILDREVAVSFAEIELEENTFEGAIRYTSETNPFPKPKEQLTDAQTPEQNIRNTQIQQINNELFYTIQKSSLQSQEDRQELLSATLSDQWQGIEWHEEDFRTLESRLGSQFFVVDNLERSIGEDIVLLPSVFVDTEVISVVKTYSWGLHDDRTMDITLQITNTSDGILQDILLTDSDSRNLFFNPSDTYTQVYNGQEEERVFQRDPGGRYMYLYDLSNIDLLPSETITISYTTEIEDYLLADIIVGDFEEDDEFWDVLYNPYEACNAEYLFWRSDAPRDYTKTTKGFLDSSEVDISTYNQAKELEEQLASGAITEEIANNAQAYSREQLEEYNKDTDGDGIPDREDYSEGSGSIISSDGLNVRIDPWLGNSIDGINNQIDDFMEGLGCGFGEWGCIDVPINYAPLAPGMSTSIFGYPGEPQQLTPKRGLPAFAAPTLIGKFPIGVWPPFPKGAGGWIQPDPPTSVFRFYITPTLTGALGFISCFGQYPTGFFPPQWVYPQVPGGNCIVVSIPLPLCSDDGSDGDVAAIAPTISSWGPQFINADSCTQDPTTQLQDGDVAQIRQDVDCFLGTCTQVVEEDMFERLTQRLQSTPRSRHAFGVPQWPILKIGNKNGVNSDPLLEFEVNLDISAIEWGDFGSIIEFNLSRVSAFPSYFMDWVTRQIEEIVNKLTTLPNLIVTLPYFPSDTPEESEITQMEVSGVSGIEGALEFITKYAPFVDFQKEVIDIKYPHIGWDNIDLWLTTNEAILAQWRDEYERIKSELEAVYKSLTQAGSDFDIDNYVQVQNDFLVELETSIGNFELFIESVENIREFPKQLRKYINIKSFYLRQLLRFLQITDNTIIDWIRFNMVRFEAWMRLYDTIQGILKNGWQPLVDLFIDYDAQCSVCRVERWDLKNFYIELISALIPDLPIIRFPKWPDIELDLHDINIGVQIPIPEIHLEPMPITLPLLPELQLPRLADTDININILLPQLRARLDIPDLSFLQEFEGFIDLPDLPTLPLPPRIEKLPVLPPPPTIPDILSSISGVLDILKLVAKIMCIYRVNPFAPEWSAGVLLTQMTDRESMFAFDFLNLEFPDINLAVLDRIRVSSHINFQTDFTFIADTAREIVQPIDDSIGKLNRLFDRQIPKKISLLETPADNSIDIDIVAPSIDVNTEVGGEGAVDTNIELDNVEISALYDVYQVKDAIENIFAKKDKESSVGDFREAITKEAEALQSAPDAYTQNLGKKLAESMQATSFIDEEFANDLEQEALQKSTLAHAIVKANIEEIELIENMLNTHEQTGEDLGTIIHAQSTQKIATNTTNTLLSQWQNSRSQIQQDIRDLQSTQQDNTSINKTSLLLANLDDGKAPIASAGGLEEDNQQQESVGYQYSGLYAINDEGISQRLTDYTEEFTGEEQIIDLDIDGDTDMDVIYRIGNTLYQKTNLSTKNTSSSISDDPEVVQIDDSYIRIYPNSIEKIFSEDEIGAYEISTPSIETGYYYQLHMSDSAIDFATEQQIAQEGVFTYVFIRPNELLQKETTGEFTQYNHLGSIVEWAGEVELYTRDLYRKLLPNNQFIVPGDETVYTSNAPVNITKGQSVFTGNQNAFISYVGTEGVEKKIKLDKYSEYVFTQNISLQIDAGYVLLYLDTYSKTKASLDTIQGYPLFADTRITPLRRSEYSVQIFDGRVYKYGIGESVQIHAFEENFNAHTKIFPIKNGFQTTKIGNRNTPTFATSMMFASEENTAQITLQREEEPIYLLHGDVHEVDVSRFFEDPETIQSTTLRGEVPEGTKKVSKFVYRMGPEFVRNEFFMVLEVTNTKGLKEEIPLTLIMVVPNITIVEEDSETITVELDTYDEQFEVPQACLAP